MNQETNPNSSIFPYFRTELTTKTAQMMMKKGFLGLVPLQNWHRHQWNERRSYTGCNIYG